MLPDGLPLAVFFTDTDLLPKGRPAVVNFLLKQHREARWTSRFHHKLLESIIGSSRWSMFDARSGIRQCPIADNWIAIGDAFMAFDPLCGRGVVDALKSGVFAAEAVRSPPSERKDRFHRYVNQGCARFNKYLVERAELYGLERSRIGNEFWKRRIIL